MTGPEKRLTAALLASLALHGGPVVIGHFLHPSSVREARESPRLEASLKTPAPPMSQPALRLEEPKVSPPSQPHTPNPLKPTAPVRPPSPATKTWASTVRQHFARLQAEGQFYPLEAIQRGLEGEVLVLIVLDRQGKVMAARVEESSGHRVLDDAALRAVLGLRSEAADTPQETLIPVRFRLR